MDLQNNFQNVINYNQQHKQQVNQQIKEIDKQIVQKDSNDYRQYLQAEAERKKWLRDMINHELNSSVSLKRQIQDRERSIDKMQDDYKSLSGIGMNYGR